MLPSNSSAVEGHWDRWGARLRLDGRSRCLPLHWSRQTEILCPRKHARLDLLLGLHDSPGCRLALPGRYCLPPHQRMWFLRPLQRHWVRDRQSSRQEPWWRRYAFLPETMNPSAMTRLSGPCRIAQRLNRRPLPRRRRPCCRVSLRLQQEAGGRLR